MNEPKDSKSNFWDTLSLSRNNDFPEGILSKLKHFDLEYYNILIDADTQVDIETNTKITSKDIFFVLENGLGPSGNSFIIDPKINENNVVVKLIDQHKEILGFAISIPCSLYLNIKDSESQIIESGLTTHLCVSLKHRHKELATYIISGIIDYGYQNSIFTGYHYINSPKSSSTILVFNYFRPLNLESAIEFGYEIPSHTKQVFNLEQRPTLKQLQQLESEYSVFPYSSYSMEPSEFIDLSFLQSQNRKLSMIFTAIRFEQLKTQFQFYTIKKDNQIIGLLIYKTLIMHVGKIGKGCPNVQVVLLEMNPKYKDIVMSKVIHHLKQQKYITMNGVCFGELTNEAFRKKFGLITCGIQYLDFYNLHCKTKQNGSDINVFYY